MDEPEGTLNGVKYFDPDTIAALQYAGAPKQMWPAIKAFHEGQVALFNELINSAKGMETRDAFASLLNVLTFQGAIRAGTLISMMTNDPTSIALAGKTSVDLFEDTMRQSLGAFIRASNRSPKSPFII